MAPLLEFEPYLVDRARKLIAWTEGQKANDQVEHVNRGHDADVVFYKDNRQPTVIHQKVPRSFEKWGRHRVFGEQEVLDEIQGFIGERGIIFDRFQVGSTLAEEGRVRLADITHGDRA